MDDGITIYLACAGPAAQRACERWLADEPGLRVVGSARAMAGGTIRNLEPSVVILDGDPDDPAIWNEIAYIENESPDSRILLLARLPAGFALSGAAQGEAEATSAAQLVAAVRQLVSAA